MRQVPRAIRYGLPICVAAAVVVLVAGQPAFLAWVVLLVGTFAILTFASLQDGTEPVVFGTLQWQGVERTGLLVRPNRWKVAWISSVALAAIGVTTAGLVAAFLPPHWERSLPITIGIAGVAAMMLGLSLQLAALAVGPNTIAMIPDGLLVRRGMMSHFIPWPAITNVEMATQGSGTHSRDVLRVTVRGRDAIQSNWLGRVLGAVHKDPSLSFALFGLRVAPEEVVRAVARCWQHPELTRRVGSMGSPMPSIDRYSAPRASNVVDAAGPVRTSPRRRTGPKDHASTLPPNGAVQSALELVSTGKVDFVTLHADEARNQYVQFVIGDSGGLDAEAVSNAHLPPGSELHDAEIEALADLGWQAPSGPSENFSLTLSVSSAAEIETASRVLIETLRDVYGLPAGQAPVVELGSKPTYTDSQPAGRRQRLSEALLIADFVLAGISTFVDADSSSQGDSSSPFHVLVPSILGGATGAIIGASVFPGAQGWAPYVPGAAGMFLGVLPYALFVAWVAGATRPRGPARIVAAVFATALLWAGPLVIPIALLAALSGSSAA